MTALFRSEMKVVLSGHRLIDPSGWMDDNGRVEYECQCGHLMYETPRESTYQGGSSMLANHQAEVLDALGYRRAPDVLDAGALEALFSLVQRRSEEVLHQRNTCAWSMNGTDRNRLRGAHEELQKLRAALESYVDARHPTLVRDGVHSDGSVVAA